MPTFDELEASATESRPVGLAFFSVGSWVLRVVAADAVQEFAGQTWQPYPVALPEIVQGAELRKNELTMTVPADFPVVQLWVEGPMATKMLVVLYDAHLGEDEARDSWTGFVSNVRILSAARAEVTLSSGQLAFQSAGLRQIASRTCRHGIYTVGCGVDPADHEVPFTVTAVGGDWIEADEFADIPDDQFLNGGFIAWTSVDGIPDTRHIRGKVGNRVTLAWRAARLEVGMDGSAYPGCDDTPNHCGPKFDNLPRFGGLWFLQSKNPFEGDPVY